MKKIIAVDFDGTIVEDEYPDIGNPIFETIDRLKIERAGGAQIILWTCRIGKSLLSAVKWCERMEIYFDAVNENIPRIIDAFGSDTRKIFANEYWDDRSVYLPWLNK